MAIINIYSKRQRKIRGEVNDVYQYNNIPHALRVQIIKIITDSIGFPSSNERYTSYRNEADKVYAGNDSNLLIVFYVQIMPDDFVMQLHRF
ncbi:hypothetical protein ANGUJ1_23905 [Escherichia coli]|nr:hypothetical protein ANGUJ1_23905 [Escherichia coli]